MVDFSAAQASLADAAKARDAAQGAVAKAVARQQSLAAARSRLLRSLDPNDRAAAAQLAQLEGTANQAAADVTAAKGALARATAAAAASLNQFAAFSDPRQNVGSLSDALPFVLFPVRIETRFASAAGSRDAAKRQLWVRIYPDDCSIDTFEDLLSATELANAKLYWQAMFRAGGIEADQRAAWSSLVAAHGSGRAGYIVDTYEPTNLPPPTKAAPTDEILVIATQTALSPAEAAAVAAYWRAIWLADGDLAQQQAAQTALVAAVGAPRAADLIAGYQPYNLADQPLPPLTKSAVAVSTAFVIFPPDPPTRQSAWSQAPQIRQFPERFVVLGYTGTQKTLEAIGNVITLPLYVGPDPSADPNVDPTSAIHPAGGDLYVPDQLKWMVDFDSAVAAGMGIAIDLTPAQATNGFDRLIVLGLQLGARETDGQATLEQMLQRHASGPAGLTLIPQGTPTHNTTGNSTGYTKLDNADQSFDDRKNAPLFTANPDPNQKRDGQWVAELLGVDPALFTGIHASGGQDQMRTRAMQRALWPATVGYWMDKLLTPVFSDDAVANTRWFFSQYVSGRGAVPAMRIGGQPYGILPTTAFSRIRWLDPKQRGQPGWNDPQLNYLRPLYAILRAVDADWTNMSAGNAHVGGTGDAHQILLDIVGLNPSSVEYYSRSAESLSELFNVANLWGVGPDFLQALNALALHAAAAGLIARQGYSGTTPPDILHHYFLRDADQITKIIDDRPLSETDPIRAYTDDGRNYIRWLIDAANVSLEALRTEQGFGQNATPQMLLYLYLRHALMLGYYDTSYGLYKGAGLLTDAALAAMKPEPVFVHVADATAAGSESRFAALYKAEPRITGSSTQLISDYIASNLGFLSQSRGLKDQLDALQVLVEAPTAELERVFAEHVDICTFRYDAWLLGLANFQLQRMRYATGGDGKTVQTGAYLGAYAWVEDLRPSTSRLAPVQLAGDIAKNFAGTSPILHDPSNGGYIHAPSLTQARTAAVLRSGYLANATPANPGTMAVNLSSDRVRLALSMLEGIRNGQNLGALLGYRFETGLHDDYGLAEVDKFIYPLRKAFPLVADSLATTKTASDVPIEAIEARNVLDGRKLIAQIAASGVATYPFALSTLPAATATEAAAINAEVSDLQNVYDAIADLALAEGVHQAAQGNFDRIAATLNAYSSGNFPPEPQVIETPPGGIGLTHRVGVHFRPGLAAPAGATPRAQAEPALNDWLASLLPPLNNIGCTVTWTDQTGSARQQPVTLDQLAISAIDLLWLIKPDAVQTMAELDDRILRCVYATAAPRPDLDITIAYMTAPAGAFSIFEVTGLVRDLKAMVKGARPLRASDVTLSNDARPDQNAAVFVDPARVTAPAGALATLSSDIGALLATEAPLLADPIANRDVIVAGTDNLIDATVALLERSARFGTPSSGWGFAYAWRGRAVADLLAQVQTLLTRWSAALADFDARIAAYDALPAATNDADRFKALRAAELTISTQPDPAPANPAALRADLDVKRNAFVAKQSQFAALLTSASTRFTDLLNAVNALLPVTAFDSQPFDLTTFGDRAVLLAQDLVANLAEQQKTIDGRHNGAQTQIAASNAAGSPAAQVQALQSAGQALFGDDFGIVPEFGLSAAQADEWANAVAPAATTALQSYLKNTVEIDFPIDEWLYGAARVRPMLHAFEAATVLAGAFGQPEPALLPAQFPFVAGAPWLAMQFPPDYVLDGDRLLYTAQYMTPFDKSARQCGLLLDEWSETIPSTTRTTGITFNFNRPDNEPPQSILLVTPAAASGSWQWDDLVGALNETLDLAKKRSVEPTQLDATPYTALVPATVMAVTLYGISITTSLAVANGALRNLEAASNG